MNLCKIKYVGVCGVGLLIVQLEIEDASERPSGFDQVTRRQQGTFRITTAKLYCMLLTSII